MFFGIQVYQFATAEAKIMRAAEYCCVVWYVNLPINNSSIFRHSETEKYRDILDEGRFFFFKQFKVPYFSPEPPPAFYCSFCCAFCILP